MSNDDDLRAASSEPLHLLTCLRTCCPVSNEHSWFSNLHFTLHPTVFIWSSPFGQIKVHKVSEFQLAEINLYWKMKMPTQLPAFHRQMRQIIQLDLQKCPISAAVPGSSHRGSSSFGPSPLVSSKGLEKKNPAETFPHKNPGDTIATTSTVIGPKYRKWEPDCKKKLHFLQTLHVCVCK